MAGYVFDNSWERERARLAGIESHLDPATTTFLEERGVGAGWVCLEIAGGGGSIAAWLCDRVGPQGRVVATDLDTRFLDLIEAPNITVLRHDIVTDELPEATYDLIHARLLLEHLPDRETVLKRLVTALKPGGWMLIEDLDWRPIIGPSPVVYNYPAEPAAKRTKIMRALVAVMQKAGYEAEFGGRLPGLFIDAGLEDVGAELHARLMRGGSPASLAPRFTIEHLREAIVAQGIAARDVDRESAHLGDPQGAWMGLPMISVWGRRPTAREIHPSGRLPERGDSMLEMVARQPIFAGCKPAERDRIAALSQRLDVEPGTALTVEGDPGDKFFIVVRGTAEVSHEDERVATLGPGSFFGETALVTGSPRTATVTAETRMRLLSFDRYAFDELLHEIPAAKAAIFEGVRQRTIPAIGWP